jgi:hypothetical protein
VRRKAPLPAFPIAVLLPVARPESFAAMRRRTWLILAIILIPLWLIGATGEIADSFLIRMDGRLTIGEVNPGQWIRGKRRYYKAEVSYQADGRDFRKEFRISPDKAFRFVDESGAVTNPKIEVLYAPSKPQVAELVIMPSDAPWISILVACIGFFVISGVFGCFYFTAKK